MELKALREIVGKIPDESKDIRLNVQSVVETDSPEPFSRETRLGIALSVAAYLGMHGVREALLTDMRSLSVSEGIIADSLSCASIMGMNTVYYRFRHFMAHAEGENSNGGRYENRPPRLRMQALASPRSSKGFMELASLAVAAVEGCEKCVVAHEGTVRTHGISEEEVHEAVRVAAVMNGLRVALQ